MKRCFQACIFVLSLLIQANCTYGYQTADERLMKLLVDVDELYESFCVAYEGQRITDWQDGSEPVIASFSGFSARNKSIGLTCFSYDTDHMGRSPIPWRSETLFFDRRIGHRDHGIGTKNPQLRRIRNVELDEHGARKRVGSTSRALELYPHGLILAGFDRAEGNSSDIEHVIHQLLTLQRFLGEKNEGSMIIGEWENPTKDVLHKITFDDRFGGMPVRSESILTDRNGKRAKGYMSVVRTEWQENNDHWEPTKIFVSGLSGTIRMEVDFQLTWLPKEDWSKTSKSTDWRRIMDDSEHSYRDPLDQLFAPQKR